jgi:hypothetical protein
LSLSILSERRSRTQESYAKSIGDFPVILQLGFLQTPRLFSSI